jgi:hypothetical protein
MQFRLPVVAAVVLVAGLRPLRAGWPEAAAATLAGALFLGHVGTIAAAWRPVDAQYRELQAALAHLRDQTANRLLVHPGSCRDRPILAPT